MNPIEDIKKDHRKVEDLFNEYEQLGEQAFQHKQEIAHKIINELENHAEMEETICYPKFEELFTKEDDKKIAEALVEHEVVKALLSELKGMSSEDEFFDAKIKVLKENVEHHVKEEEEEVLPKAEEEMSEEDVAEMTELMKEFRQRVME